jgi:predicted Zn-dependent protease
VENEEDLVMNISNIKINKKMALIAITALVVLVILGMNLKSNLEKKQNESNRLLIKQSEEKLSEANILFYNGEFQLAIEKYNEIDTSQIEDERLIEALKYIYLSQAYYLNKDIEAATENLEKAKATNNKDDLVLSLIVSNEFLRGNKEQALSLGEQYLSETPNNKKLIKTMVGVYIWSNEKEKAVDMIERYAENKNSAYDLAEKANMYLIVDDVESGLKFLKNAWNLDKDEFKIYDVLSQSSIYKKDAMITYINDLQKNDEKELCYKMWLAKLYSDNEKTANGSINLLNELEEENIDNVETKLIEIVALNKLGRVEEANTLINEVLEETNGDYRIYHSAAWISLANGDIDNAKVYAYNSIEKNGAYLDNYSFLMPSILNQENDMDKAESYIYMGRISELYNIYIIDNLANIYMSREDGLQKSEELFNELKNIKNSEPEITYKLAIIYANSGNIDKAIEALNECIKLDAQQGKYYRTLGSLMIVSNREEEGIIKLREAYALDETDILTLNNAGSYYISFTDDIHKGFYNLQKAFQEINEYTDPYYKQVIEENYEKAQNIIEAIENGKANEKVTIPEFTLLF